MTDRVDIPGGLLVVTLDRLPAWILPAFGCTWVGTPALDALAARGLLLDRVIARSDHPHDTLMDFAGRSPGAADAWPLLKAAAAAGWSPALVTDDEALANHLPAETSVQLVSSEVTGRLADDERQTHLGGLFAAATKLAAAGNHRLLWCHAASLGVAWDAPKMFREAYLDPDDPPPPAGATVPEVLTDATTDPDLVVVMRQVFAGQLSLFDRLLGQLLDAVAAAGQDWTVLIAGVRGLGLGLHGSIGCGPLAPFGELIQLPALIVDHRGRMAAQRYGGLLLPADIGVTLLDCIPDLATNLPADTLARSQPRATPAPHPAEANDDPRVGRSLAGLFNHWQPAGRDRGITVASHGIAVATPAWHLVLPTPDEGSPDRPHLYAKPDDYFEACDVADRCPDVAEELTQLAQLAAADPRQAWAAPLSRPATEGL